MRKFISIRHSKIAKAGTWWVAEDVGEPLFRAQLMPGGVLKQVSHVGVPFNSLAEYIVEPGFSIPRNTRPSVEDEVKEIADFQNEVEDIIEPELEARQRKLDPTYTGRTE